MKKQRRKSLRNPSPALAATLPRADSTSLFLDAVRCHRAGDNQQAEAISQQILEQNKQNADALHLLGKIAHQQDKLDSAAELIGKAISANKSVPYFHYDLANVFQDQGKLDRGISAYQKALRLKRDYAEAHNDLGTALAARGLLDDAVKSYREAVRFNPDHETAHSNLGAALWRQKKYHEARRCYQKVLKLRVQRVLERIAKWPSRLTGKGHELNRQKTASPLSFEIAPVNLFVSAQQFQQAGNSQLAEAICGLIPPSDPEHAQALHMLGIIAYQNREHDKARDLISRAVAINSSVPDFHNNLGNVFNLRGQADKAIASYRQALVLQPDFVEAYNNLGHVLYKQGNHDEAIACYQKALRLKPELAESHNWLGLALQQKGRLDEASECYQEAIRLQPGLASAHVNLGTVLIKQSKLDEAVPCCQEALRLEPRSAEALNSLGVIYLEKGKGPDAINYFKRALSARPDFAEALNNLGLAHQQQSELDQSIACYRKVLRQNPGYADAHNNLGVTFQVQGKLDEAMACYREALRLRPELVNANIGESAVLLLLGEFAEGWKKYEQRLLKKEVQQSYDRFNYPRWDGSPLGGRTSLIYSEQGIGDHIMFASCLPEVIAQAGHCVVECEPKLAPIFKRSFPTATVHGGTHKDPVDWVSRLRPIDVQLPIGSLPFYLRNSLADFPRHQGYLRAAPERVAYWRKRLDEIGSGTKIGLSWRGGVLKTGRVRRSVELEELLPILKRENIHFISLQYTDCREELAKFQKKHGVTVHHWQEAIDDYDETAALLCALDLTISICTALVHLGGALSRPVWVMAPFSPEWRYGFKGENMPWYPSVKVLRQPAYGDWQSLIEKTAQKLSDYLSHAGAGEIRPLDNLLRV